MNLRAAVLSVALVAGAVAPVWAQETPAAASPAPTFSSEHITAGDNLFRAIIYDGGAIERIFEIVESDMIPELRADILRSPLYQSATPDRREALMVVIDSLPSYLRQELLSALATTGPRIAERFAERMSIEHLNETAAFMRSPEIRERWRTMVDDGIEKDTPMPSFPAWRTVGDFAATPAGEAFARQEEALGDILDEETEQTLRIAFPRMLTVIAGQMCDALGSDCPTHMRDAAGRI